MRGLVALGLLAGCYQPQLATGVPCGTGDVCPTGLECRGGTCELPGSQDATIDVAIDACVAPARCENNQLVTCAGAIACELGCDDTSDAHCRALAPSNGVTPDLLAGATADVVGDWNFYTDDGEIRRGNQTLRGPGPGVIAGIGFAVVDGMAVWSANSFTVDSTADWDVSGDLPIVLYAATTITVNGLIDVGAVGSTGGPGGSSGTFSMSGSSCRGRAGRYHAAGLGEGGGGGGGRTAGGDGGASSMANPTGLGGSLCASLPSTIPLRGGAGGGHGAATSLNDGGGGGGAIALVAMHAISISGTVGAPGEGGDSGVAGASPGGDAGGGGGGGGAVLLEAPIVTITGEVTANGGGGGGPSVGDGQRGSLTSATPATGGSFTGPGGTVTGGRGGAGTTAPGNGATYTYDDGLGTATSVVVRGSGGGGAAGRIEIRALASMTNGAVISPPPAVSDAELE